MLFYRNINFTLHTFVIVSSYVSDSNGGLPLTNSYAKILMLQISILKS